MPRLMSLVAALLGVATSTGVPVVKQPTLSVEVDGLDGLEHRPLLVMYAGGPYWMPCESVREAIQLQFTPGRFALYEDGLVIFTRSKGASCALMEANIGRENALAFVERIFGAGFAEVRYESWPACTDMPGVTITARRGTRWHQARVLGIDRFANIHCLPDEGLHPTFLAALDAITRFDAPGAVPWVPREFSIRLGPSEGYPVDMLPRAVPWPEGLPAPATAPGAHRIEQFYDGSFSALARSIVSPGTNSFVVLDGKIWAYGYDAEVFPEHAYLEKLFRMLRERGNAMGLYD